MYNLTGDRGKQGDEPKEKFDNSDRKIALQTLGKLKKPCILYKILGAGRLRLQEGLKDVRRHLRSNDAVLLGMYPPDTQDMVGEAVRQIAALM